MTVLRESDVEAVPDTDSGRDGLGHVAEARYGDAGGLTQFGANLVTLAPGATSSHRHWHEAQDEFLYVLEGEATVVEDDGPHVLGPGDGACWPAGAPNAHHVLNRADAPCRFLVVGTRTARDVVRYPDLGRTTYHDGKDWRVTDDRTGAVLRQGRDR
jgi:uncharacterized cupin superfamily protein